MHTVRRGFTLALAAGVLAIGSPAFGQTGAYPTRPIRFIVPFAPGGSSDATARMVAEGLQKLLGQPVVVDNQGGASGIIGTLAAVRAAPDGYTLVFSTSTNHVIAPLLRQPRPYDPVKDFTAVAPLVVYDGAFIVSSAVPANTVAEFMALAKASPGKMNFGSAGIGSTNHLATEQLKTQSGLELLHVPYKGSAASIMGVAANEVQMTIDTIASALPLVKAGKVRMLAVNTPQRSPAAPEVPTFREAGIKEIANYWQGISGPAGLPADVVARLNQAVTQVMGGAEMKARMAQIGASVSLGSAESFASSIKAETATWTEVIRANAIKAE